MSLVIEMYKYWADQVHYKPNCLFPFQNGNYVVSMTWLEAEVKLTCPILQSPDAQHPWTHPVPHRPSSFYRPKRHLTHPISIYDPLSTSLYWYYFYLNQNQAMAPTTTTAEPDTTTTSKPTTEKPQNPHVYHPYMYYPYLYYPYYYYPLPGSTPATTAPATTAPATTAPATTAPATTADTTTSTPTAETQKPMDPYYPMYYPYPDYYSHIIWHLYGNHPNPSDPMQTTTPPPTSTTPKTASTSTQTTQPCSKPKTTTSSGSYPGKLSPFVGYYESPFAHVISYAYNRAGKLSDDQKYMPQYGYKSVPLHRAHSGDEWWAVPCFFHSTGRGITQIDWENLQLH